MWYLAVLHALGLETMAGWFVSKTTRASGNPKWGPLFPARLLPASPEEAGGKWRVFLVPKLSAPLLRPVDHVSEAAWSSRPTYEVTRHALSVVSRSFSRNDNIEPFENLGGRRCRAITQIKKSLRQSSMDNHERVLLPSAVVHQDRCVSDIERGGDRALCARKAQPQLVRRHIVAAFLDARGDSAHGELGVGQAARRGPLHAKGTAICVTINKSRLS